MGTAKSSLTFCSTGMQSISGVQPADFAWIIPSKPPSAYFFAASTVKVEVGPMS